MAHRLARREGRTVVEIVERALEEYENQQAQAEPAARFYARLSAEFGVDIDLESVIREARRPHRGCAL